MVSNNLLFKIIPPNEKINVSFFISNINCFIDKGIYHLQRPYYSEEDPPIYSAVVNNNNTTKDKNILVTAVPSHAPDWVRIDPSYDLDQDDPDASTGTNISSSTMSNTTFSIEDEETNPSVWAPE